MQIKRNIESALNQVIAKLAVASADKAYADSMKRVAIITADYEKGEASAADVTEAVQAYKAARAANVAALEAYTAVIRDEAAIVELTE